ncbi:MAG: cytochrome c oxidase subunit I [Alphaproteobacteria bacterium]
MTEPRRPLSALARHRRLAEVWSNPPFPRSAAAVSHTILGKRFMATALVFFLIGGILAMLIRAQLATSDNAFLDHDLYNQIFTMHGTVMMFLFAIPMIEGLAIYLIPKMTGARDLAFPRLTAFGYWCYLFGGMILLGALFLGVAPDGGWFMYTPLSSRAFTPGVNADVWLLGVTFVEISAICAAVEVTVSILSMRTAGMSLARMPLFAWYILVTVLMMLVGFPPLILGSLILELERAFDWPFFDVARGGDPLLWAHLFWLFGHPEVYIIFLPAAGIVSTLVPVFAGRPIVGYTAIVVSVFAIGFISFGLWVHHMFTVGIPHLAQVFFSAASMLVAIPTAVQFFAWIATLWSGRPRLELPMLYLFGFLVIFVAGGLTGVMLALVPFNWQVHDTQFVVAHLHYVLVGGFIFPVMAGIYYWFPHVTGRATFPALGKVAFWLIFVGFNLTFLIMHLTGLIGMPRRVYVYPAGLGWDFPNLVSSIGGFVMSIGFGLLIVDLVLSWHLGPRTKRNPWKASTLEWAMTTPPALYNLASLPEVRDRDPLWSDPALPGSTAAGRHRLPGDDAHQQESLGVDMISGRPTHVVVLPRPSWLPLWGGLAMAVFFLLFLVGQYALAPIGLLLALPVFLRWAWVNGLKADPAPRDTGVGEELPLHHVAADAPGWLGLVFTLVADATLLASLLFGYVYILLIAPGPAPIYAAPGLELPLLAAAALAGAGLSARLARRANAVGAPGRCGVLLVLSALSGLGAAAVLTWAAVAHLPHPTLHASAATAAVGIGYAVFHALLGVVFSGFALARLRAGFVSPRRNLDLRVMVLWWDYSVVAGFAVLAAVFGVAAMVQS